MELQVSGGRSDVPAGGVVARQVVHSHVCDPDWVRQRDSQRPLRPRKRPTRPNDDRGTLGEEKGETGGV